MPTTTVSHREEAIINGALQLPAEQRTSYVTSACGGDAPLRGRVQALLAGREKAGDPATSTGPPAGPQGTMVLNVPLAEPPGDRIGRYKVLQQIGEGGCGVVYMADQEEPVRRRVALKVIKLGMDTGNVIARFEAERQALALMDHPNIARVLDAGATETGRPYFVMELVKGIPITRYCDEINLSTVTRLGLFIQVCQAIQHAHQKGIIHRDIKPSNILVGEHDGVPVPKIIDFGIAKATTDQRLTDRTLFTAFEQFIGTPAYMSPEQAKLSGLDIDTRSDIYSLGVLLYELLVGKTPFESKRLLESGLDEIRRIIREEEPMRPSMRLDALDAAEQTKVARHRQSDAPKLLHVIRGDLDWIVMKCLDKDRARRYETANGLAMDLQRYLNNEPVVARPPSAAYRLQKAFRRHRLAFAAGTAIASALILGVIGTTLGLLRAEKLRQVAEAARQGESRLREIAVKSLEGEKQQRMRAEAQELAARRSAYSSDMNLAQQALTLNNLGRARRLLNRQRPQPGQRDLRDWEWRYLWSQTRADDQETFFAGTNRLFHPLSFSADGALLAREEEGETIVSDLVSHRWVFRRPNALRPVFSHRGGRLAFVDASSTNPVIGLLDIATQVESRFKTACGKTRWIGFTPDDRRLLAASSRPGDETRIEDSYDLTAWDVDTGRELWRRPIGFPSTQNGRPYAISPDGAALAAVLPDGRVQVLETRDGRERFTITVTEELSITVTFSPDNATLLTGAGYTDSTIRLWDARNGKPAGSLEGHRSWVSDLLFTVEGKLLISSSGDQTIRLWDWATLKPAGVLRGHLDEVDGLALAPNGRTLASRCKDGSIYLWDVTKPSRHLGYEILSSHLDSSSIVFTPDSRSILGVELNGGVAVWDSSTLKETRRLQGDLTNGSDTVISPDARWVMRGDADGRLRVWDARNGLESTNFVAAAGRFYPWITENGKFLVTLYSRPTNTVLEAWHTDTWQRKSSLTLPFKSGAWAFTTSRPNSFVIATDRGLRFFDVTKLDQAPQQIESRGELLALATSPDGRMGAGAYEDGSVRLWEMATLKQLESLKGFLLAANSVAFSPDGRRLAAGSQGQEAVKLWDAETRQEVLTLSGEGSQVVSLKFSPDGRFLLAVNSSGLAHVWSAPTWAEIDLAEADEKRAPQR
jgi:WD40 repeat protein